MGDENLVTPILPNLSNGKFCRVLFGRILQLYVNENKDNLPSKLSFVY